MKKKYDWIEIQRFYDGGNSTRDINKIFGVNYCSIWKAVKRGDLKTRMLSDAMFIARKNKPDSFKPSAETKKKISDTMKQYFIDNPESHPNRRMANNRTKWTYPERIVAEFLDKRNIVYSYNKRVLKYYPDFLLENKIIIEVDGDRWHSSIEAKEKDKLRDSDLSKAGYKVYRLSFKGNVKLLLENLKKYIGD